jgi:hypothetical protein
MCLLTYFPPTVQPDLDGLLNGSLINDDGHGYAIVVPRKDRIVVGRGMDASAVISEFAILRELYPDGPALFHSRFGTHGAESVANCHPFAVGGDHRTVIAHNGILPRNVRPKNGDSRSDTRIAAEDFIPSVGPLRRERVRRHLERWMSAQNKMVILTVDPAFNGNAFILNEDKGIWEGDIWYSNYGYEPWSYSTGYYTYNGKQYSAGDDTPWWDDDEATGKVSGYADIIAKDPGTCPDCRLVWADCDCWLPVRQAVNGKEIVTYRRNPRRYAIG